MRRTLPLLTPTLILVLLLFISTSGVVAQSLPVVPEELRGEKEACGEHAIATGLGCIPTQPTAFAGWFLGWAIGLAGGIAFLLILFGGFRVITSAGDPEKLQGGKDLITASVAGLLVIIFSLFLLRIIGFGILQLPGFPRS